MILWKALSQQNSSMFSHQRHSLSSIQNVLSDLQEPLWKALSRSTIIESGHSQRRTRVEKGKSINTQPLIVTLWALKACSSVSFSLHHPPSPDSLPLFLWERGSMRKTFSWTFFPSCPSKLWLSFPREKHLYSSASRYQGQSDKGEVPQVTGGTSLL